MDWGRWQSMIHQIHDKHMNLNQQTLINFHIFSAYIQKESVLFFIFVVDLQLLELPTKLDHQVLMSRIDLLLAFYVSLAIWSNMFPIVPVVSSLSIDS